MTRVTLTWLLMVAAWLISVDAQAQPQPSEPAAFDTPIGAPITLAQAKRALSAAAAELSNRHWKMSCAITEPSGDLVYFEKMDGTAYASIFMSQGKARSAALFRRQPNSFRTCWPAGRTSR
jgi:glc operon protein GlcG